MRPRLLPESQTFSGSLYRWYQPAPLYPWYRPRCCLAFSGSRSPSRSSRSAPNTRQRERSATCSCLLPPLSSDVELSRTLAPPSAAVESTEPATTVESTEPATAVESAKAMEIVESTRAHAAPAAGAVGPRRPAAKIATMRAQTAERIRPSGPVVVLRPGVGVCEMVVAERAGLVDVDGVSADVPVEVSAGVAVEVSAVEVVAIEIALITVRVVSAVVGVGVGTTGVATVPGGIAVEGVVVVHHRAARPVASPRGPSPSGTRERTKCHAATERERAREGDVSRRVAWRHIRVAVDDGGVVLRDVDDLRIRWLNDNRLRALLHDRHLRRRFQVPGSLGLRSQSLNGRHDLGLLHVIRLA